MNKKFISGLTLGLLLGSALPHALASSDDRVKNNQEKQTQANYSDNEPNSPEKNFNLPKNTQLTKIYHHSRNGVNAATLYVESIPILTFLGSATDSKEVKVITDMNLSRDEDKTNPVNRAKIVAQALEKLKVQKADLKDLTVSWNDKNKNYDIKFKEELIVTVDKKTILADSTGNLAVDALQVTNRLRRLMGNVAPLTEVAGLPKPKPIARQTNKIKTRKRNIATNRRVIRRSNGMASWYGPGFHGRRTANGERYNQYAMTAAHKTLAFGTRVRVTNLNNGRSVIVRINDRGPYIRSRVIDLSAAAARNIGMVNSGVAPVRLEILRR